MNMWFRRAETEQVRRRCAAESNQARDEPKPIRPTKTKDRNRNRIAALECVDSDVSMSSSAQDMEDQERPGRKGCAGPRCDPAWRERDGASTG